MTRRCDYAWRLVLIPLTVLTVLADARQVLAVPFVYSFDGTGTGTLDVFSFTNAAFHIKTYGDTADVVGAAGGRFELRNPTIVTTIDIGFAHGTFLIPTRLFDNQTLAALGLSRAHAPNDADLLDLSDPAFKTYDLRTEIGPIFVAAPFAVNQFNNIPLDIGTLTFASAQDITFQVSPTPEPSTLILWGTSAAWVGLVRWLRRRRT